MCHRRCVIEAAKVSQLGNFVKPSRSRSGFPVNLPVRILLSASLY